LGWVQIFPLVVGWVELGQPMGWVGSVRTKWTHGQLWAGGGYSLGSCATGQTDGRTDGRIVPAADAGLLLWARRSGDVDASAARPAVSNRRGMGRSGGQCRVFGQETRLKRFVNDEVFIPSPPSDAIIIAFPETGVGRRSLTCEVKTSKPIIFNWHAAAIISSYHIINL